MNQHYKTGDVFKIKLEFGFETFVTIVPHKHGIGFKSVLADQFETAINTEVLKKYNHEYVCKGSDIEQYKSIWELMDESRSTHVRLWENFGAQGWSNHEDFQNNNNAKMN